MVADREIRVSFRADEKTTQAVAKMIEAVVSAFTTTKPDPGPGESDA